MLYLTDVNDYVRECVRWKKARLRAGVCVCMCWCTCVLMRAREGVVGDKFEEKNTFKSSPL